MIFPALDVGLIAQAVRTHLGTPGRLELPARPDVALDLLLDDGKSALPILGATVAFTVSRSRGVGSLVMHGESGVPDLDALLSQAVRDASAAGALDGLPTEGPDSLRVWVRVTAASGFSSAGRAHRLSAFRVRLPRYALTVPQERRSERPAYPLRALQAAVEDSALVAFTVGVDGRVDLRSVEFVWGRYRDFFLEILRILPKWEFTPASHNGCPIAARVLQPFQFALKR